MKPRVAAAKQAASHVCKHQKFPLQVFMERGLEAILLDAENGNYTSQEIATNILVNCCVENGQYNKFDVAFMTVIKILTDAFGEASIGSVQMFRDLGKILNSGGVAEVAIREWMDTHYG